MRIRRCRCGSTASTAICTGFPATPAAASRSPTTRPVRRSIQPLAPAAGVTAARAFLARRFPALADAPLLGAEVCQYEASPDSHYIVDRHPAAPHVWIAGGGSGHGFKMGPALGEMLASCVLGSATPD